MKRSDCVFNFQRTIKKIQSLAEPPISAQAVKLYRWDDIQELCCAASKLAGEIQESLFFEQVERMCDEGVDFCEKEEE